MMAILRLTRFLILPALTFFTLQVQAQYPPTLDPDGGGAWTPDPEEHGLCVPQELRELIEKQLAFHSDSLMAAGLLPIPDTRSAVALQWPVRARAELGWPGYFGISNFVDQQTSSAILDHNCGNRTYDGHRGVDIFSWPFPWWIMENDLVEVVAAAPGTILSKFDGNSSYSCDWNGNQNWNAVYIQHVDGSVAWYGHLKKNSLTTKGLGASVEAGEYLGIMASSGRSSGPHLHLELYRQAPYTFSNLIDPYSGACNSLNTNSWWEEIQPYREPTLNTILTHSQPIELGCPTINEKGFFQKQFGPGSTIYFGRFFRDQLTGHVSVQRIRRPNGSIFQEWSHTSPNTYNASWWWNQFTLSPAAPFGLWTYEAEYLGQFVSQPFYYGVPYTCETTLLASSLEICSGESVTLNASPTEGTAPYIYTWNSSDLAGIGGVVAPLQTTVYTVTVSDHFGCSPGQATVTVVVKSHPEIGVLEEAGVLLSEQLGADWQWLDCLDDWKAIPGETESSFAPSVSGLYAVQVDLLGCVDTSECVDILLTSRENPAPRTSLRVLPNPAKDYLQILSPTDLAPGTLTLFDLLGRPVRYAILTPGEETHMSLIDLPSGVYILEYHGQPSQTRILVQKE